MARRLREACTVPAPKSPPPPGGRQPQQHISAADRFQSAHASIHGRFLRLNFKSY